ncbi:MraY family glycosyltransferase [Archaeoglobus neptunius]|uniref:hypothetical protein n=1 Tax=Archaeoglobus neptunius TaxID=2798580 RepID=UPI00192700C7|nr:hypothetical protein [Archaeoglobus neptunius]
MENSGVYLLIAISFLLSVIVVSAQIRKFRKVGLLAPDYYKPDLRKVPTGGGISILIVLSAVFSLVYILNSFWSNSILPPITRLDWKALIVICFFGLFGLLDDYADVGRITKIILTFSFSLPLAIEVSTGSIFLPYLGLVFLGIFYWLIVIPMYIMVTSNLVNMHSGFNGMAVGLTSIIIAFLLIKSILSGRDTVFTLATMLGVLLGLLWYNRYPSRIFEGNVGALSMGAAIGASIVANGFLVSGFIMLVPHVVNFLMYVYWRLMRKLHPEDPRWESVKFGKVREDGTIEVPNSLTLKWVLPHRFRMKEWQIVLAMYSLTFIFCIFGLFVDY